MPPCGSSVSILSATIYHNTRHIWTVAGAYGLTVLTPGDALGAAARGLEPGFGDAGWDAAGLVASSSGDCVSVPEWVTSGIGIGGDV